MKKTGKDLFELFAEDPKQADKLVFGRVPNPDRRGFLKGAGLATMAAVVGAAIPFHRYMPSGFIPAAMAKEPFRIQGKKGLIILNDRPVNAELPAHLLDDEITPTERLFVRNNGIPPAAVDAASWTLTVDGEVNKPLELSIEDLKKNFEVLTLALQLECGGNGRAYFDPKAKGNQWTVDAVGCCQWTGVRLADVLKAASLKDSAIYTAHFGADTHLSGKPGKLPISRGVPIAKAMDPHNLIAFEQNAAPIHPMNGAPLRLLIPGWPGSFSHKWLQRIWIRDRVHDGPKMTGKAYRLPEYPVSPGEKIPKDKFKLIKSMPVKSLITYPASGVKISAAKPALQVRGHAWAGDNKVWARATDDRGVMQPFAIAWNPKGYLNNSMHRIALRVV